MIIFRKKHSLYRYFFLFMSLVLISVSSGNASQRRHKEYGKQHHIKHNPVQHNKNRDNEEYIYQKLPENPIFHPVPCSNFRFTARTHAQFICLMLAASIVITNINDTPHSHDGLSYTEVPKQLANDGQRLEEYPASSRSVGASANRASPFFLSAKEKKDLFSKLEIAYRDAEACEPEVKKQIAPFRNLEEIIKKTKTCNDVVNSWTDLRPQPLTKISLSVKPGSEHVLVQQRHYAIANHNDAKFVLATANLWKCVGLALYNPERRRGGLAHIDGENIRSLDAHLEGEWENNDFLTYFLEVAGETPPDKIKATLVGGSSAHINYFKAYMEDLGIREFSIIHEHKWQDTDFPNSPKGNIAINCQNGQIHMLQNEPVIRQKIKLIPISNKPEPLVKADSSDSFQRQDF